MAGKVIAIAGATACGLVLVVYWACFRHPPASVILASQAKERKKTAELEPGKEYFVSEIAEAVWIKWVNDNRYVSVGDVYDSCEPPERTTIGQVIILPDVETGGVKTRIFINNTVDADIQYGEFLIDIKYNGRNLYENHFDLCTFDGDDPKPMIQCPLKKGLFTLVKDFHVPSYIPKGRYTTKGWVTNEDKRTVMCGYSDITI